MAISRMVDALKTRCWIALFSAFQPAKQRQMYGLPPLRGPRLLHHLHQEQRDSLHAAAIPRQFPNGRTVLQHAKPCRPLALEAIDPFSAPTNPQHQHAPWKWPTPREIAQRS